MRIHGYVAEGYGAVADTFRRTVDGTPSSTEGRGGASVCVLVDGDPVVDLWSGLADPLTSRPWTRNTPAVIFSCTKGLVSILAHMLVESGQLDLARPVSDYWADFAAARKADIPVISALAHRAGLPAPTQDLSLQDILDGEPVLRALEHQAPIWSPGTTHGYHALTWGWLIGTVIQRITGHTVGEFFDAAIASPLRAEAWIGIPPSLEDSVARMLRLPSPSPSPSPLHPLQERGLTMGGAFPATLVDGDSGFNDPRVHAAEIAAAGGIATARALATVWSATVTPTNGVRLLSDTTLATATRVQSEGPGHFPSPGPWLRWGAGFMLDSPGVRPFLTSASFGHDGAGGQLGFADPHTKTGFGYISNTMHDAAPSTALIASLRETMGA